MFSQNTDLNCTLTYQTIGQSTHSPKMSTEGNTSRGQSCDPGEDSCMAEASSQAAGDIGSGKSHVDFAPEVLLGTNDVRSRTYSSSNRDRDNFVPSYQGNSNRRGTNHDHWSSQGTDRSDGYHDQLDEMAVVLENLRQTVYRHNDRPGYKPKTIMPDKFDVKGSWPEFLVHFESVANLNNWNNRDKSQYLSISLRGEACQVMRFLQPHEKNSYDCLVAALGRRFNPGNRTELYRVQLRNRVRQDREGIPQLAQSIRHLTLQAYPQANGDLFEVLCRDHFLDALSDSDLRFKVYQAQTKTFDEAVAVAIQMEAFQQADKHRSRRYVREVEVVQQSASLKGEVKEVAAVSRQSDKTSNAAIMDQLESLTKIVKELQSRRPPLDLSKYTCWNCGETGHTKTYCTKPRLDKDFRYSKPQQLKEN